MGVTRVLLYLGLCVIMLLCAVHVECKVCPPPSKMYSHKPVCRDDYDCKQGKLCCPNGTGFKSCAEPEHGSSSDDKYITHQGGAGKYCGSSKCSPFQKCVIDKYGRHSCK